MRFIMNIWKAFIENDCAIDDSVIFSSMKHKWTANVEL